jgi:uncharacterized membrane protein YphA (DoxX/SURF4 family)
MSFKTLRHKARWWNLVIGTIFVVSSVYLDSVGLAAANPLWIWIALLSPVLTLAFVVLTIPRWQSFVGLAVVAYAVFWLYSQWFPQSHETQTTSVSSVNDVRTDTESANPI